MTEATTTLTHAAAQMVRASLLAIAATTTLYGRRANKQAAQSERLILSRAMRCHSAPIAGSIRSYSAWKRIAGAMPQISG